MNTKAMFASLKPGDLLTHNCGKPGCQTDHDITVLKIGEDKDGFLACISWEGKRQYLPWPGNPLRWSEKAGAVVDCDGDIVVWFAKCSLERGVHMKEVE